MKKNLTLLFFFVAFVSHAQTVTISSSAPSNIICSGNSVTFTANTTGFTNPYYQWYLNGGAISGATNSTYTSNVLTNNDGINVKVTEGPAGSITTNGLILNLDATNPASYPGSGTTWNNLVTGNAVTEFTIQSAGTYSTDNGGVIRFGNTNSGAGASSSTGFSNLSTYTVEVWVKPAGTMGDYDPSVEGNTNYTPSFFAEKKYPVTNSRVNMVLAYNARGLTNGTPNNSYRYEAAINNGSWKKYQIPTNYSSDLNNWVQIISSYNGSTLTIYRNGVSLGTSPALGVTSLRTPSDGYWIAHRWDQNDGVYGDYSKVMMYDRALSAAEVSANYTAFNTRFVGSGVSSSTINTTVYASPSIPAITMEGDACINKTTLSTASVSPIYVWAKDDVFISGASSNTYVPTTAGNYKVLVSNGTCASASSVISISTCGVTADGGMRAITSPTTLVSHEGGVNFGTGVSELGTTVNATGISTTLGTVGATTAVVSGVISATNARTTSIGVIYSTDSNFGTYSTSSTQSNVVAGSYAISLSGLTASTTYHAKAFITNKAGTSYGPAVSFTTTTPPIEVGNSYGGGLVFYIFQSGDPGYVAGETHGLIASSSDLSTYTDWKNNGGFTDIATGTGIGTGLANTNAIISSHGSSATYAAGFARAYNGGGYTDWYLPSRDELYKMHISIGQGANNIANMRSETYWSSSQSDSYQAYYMFAQNGSITTIWKDWGKAVRAIRTF